MILPMLDLQTPEGALFPWQEHWQKHNVLALITHPDCTACRRVLEAWSRRAPELAAENVVALAIGPAPLEAPPPIHPIADPQGRLAARLGVEPGAIVAADRFFEILQVGDAHAGDPADAARDALDWIRLAERKCDECGVPTW